MTPEEVHNVAFGKPPIGHRGYDEEEVDALLDLIETTLSGQPRVTRDQLATVNFRKPPIGKRGYRQSDVNEFLQRVIAEWPVWP